MANRTRIIRTVETWTGHIIRQVLIAVVGLNFKHDRARKLCIQIWRKRPGGNGNKKMQMNEMLNT